MKAKYTIFYTILLTFCYSNNGQTSEKSTKRLTYTYTKIPQDRFYENDNHYSQKNALPKKENAKFILYKTKGNETLMLIAFELYSDFKKWKQIARDNKDVLKQSHKITPGIALKIRTPLKPRIYPKGLPYIIKQKDTLGKISRNVYGKNIYWKSIYQNNKDQIKNPHLIFAGFTLFYQKLPQLSRDEIASLD